MKGAEVRIILWRVACLPLRDVDGRFYVRESDI